jgi:hypothetical protein
MVEKTPAPRRRARRAALAMLGLGTAATMLSGCDASSMNVGILSLVQPELTCTQIVLHDPIGLTIGPAVDSVTGVTTFIHGEVYDATGTLLLETPEFSTLTTTGSGNDVLGTYTAPPTLNPVYGGLYFRDDDSTEVEGAVALTGHCAGLPIAAYANLAPDAGAALRTTLPVFDVYFLEPMTGFDVGDLELGGTAGPTGATITSMSNIGWRDTYGLEGFGTDYSALIDPTAIALRNIRGTDDVYRVDFYRVAVTGVTDDGTVTLRLPAGAVLGAGSTDGNIGTSTVTATIDTTGPTLGTVADITRQLIPGEASAAISWAAPAASDANGVATQSCTPASGSTFGSGATTVHCTAADPLGNDSTTDFVVTVLPALTPTVQLVPLLTGAPDQGDTATFTVTATDYTGTTAPLLASDYAVTSSVPSDVIHTSDGSFTVTFPHASPHVLTVTQTSTGAVANVTVQVTPAAAPAALGATGTDAATPLATAIVLGGLGAGLLAGMTLLSRRRRRQSA